MDSICKRSETEQADTNQHNLQQGIRHQYQYQVSVFMATGISSRDRVSLMPRLAVLRPRLVCLVCGHFGCWLGGRGVCGALTEGRVTRPVRLEDAENGEDADNKQTEEDEPA